MRPMRRLAGWGAVMVVVAFALAAGVLAPVSAAEPPTVDWSVSVGAVINDVAADGSGGAVVVGQYAPFATEHAGVIARYGPGGHLLWRDRWTPRRGFVYGLGVAVHRDGTVVAVGGIECDGWEATGAFVRGYTAGGHLRWSVISRGGWCKQAVRREKATDVAIAHGLVVVVGHTFECCGIADENGWIRAYDMQGERAWRTNFEVPGMPRGNNDALAGIAPTRGGFVVTGYASPNLDHDTATWSDTEIVVAAVDVGGDLRWVTALRDEGVKDYEGGNDVSVRRGRIVVAGSIAPWATRRPRGWVAGFSRGGEVRWADRWEPRTSAHGVSVAPDGSVWVVGDGEVVGDGSMLLMRSYDRRGRQLWSLSRDPATYSNGSAVAADDVGAFVAGVEDSGRSSGRLWRYVLGA